MGLFKQPEYRRFNLKRIRAELGLPENGDEYIPDVRTGLQKEYAKRKGERAGLRLGYSTRLFMILIIILIGIFYLATYKIDLIMKLF